MGSSWMSHPWSLMVISCDTTTQHPACRKEAGESSGRGMKHGEKNTLLDGRTPLENISLFNWCSKSVKLQSYNLEISRTSKTPFETSFHVWDISHPKYPSRGHLQKVIGVSRLAAWMTKCQIIHLFLNPIFSHSLSSTLSHFTPLCPPVGVQTFPIPRSPVPSFPKPVEEGGIPNSWNAPL